MELDTSKWSGEGTFTQALIDCLKQIDGLSCRKQLPGYFMGFKSSITKASQEVGALWLNSTQRLNMSSSHSFYCGSDLQTIKIIRV